VVLKCLWVKIVPTATDVTLEAMTTVRGRLYFLNDGRITEKLFCNRLLTSLIITWIMGVVAEPGMATQNPNSYIASRPDLKYKRPCTNRSQNSIKRPFWPPEVSILQAPSVTFVLVKKIFTQGRRARRCLCTFTA
jgi:hypothetical protein